MKCGIVNKRGRLNRRHAISFNDGFTPLQINQGERWYMYTTFNIYQTDASEQFAVGGVRSTILKSYYITHRIHITSAFQLPGCNRNRLLSQALIRRSNGDVLDDRMLYANDFPAFFFRAVEFFEAVTDVPRIQSKSSSLSHLEQCWHFYSSFALFFKGTKSTIDRLSLKDHETPFHLLFH